MHRQFQAANRRQAGMETMLVEREAASTDMVATVVAASIVAVRGYSSGAMVPVYRFGALASRMVLRLCFIRSTV